MSIRNSLVLALYLCMTTLTICSSDTTQEWDSFKDTHDLFLLIKNTYKNEDRWVHFSLQELPDDSLQVTWILREDFLPKEKGFAIDEMRKEQQCNVYEQRVGCVEEKFRMLTVGLVESHDQNYSFVMHDYYTCVTAFVAPNEKASQGVSVREKLKDKAVACFVALKQRINHWMPKKG